MDYIFYRVDADDKDYYYFIGFCHFCSGCASFFFVVQYVSDFSVCVKL